MTMACSSVNGVTLPPEPDASQPSDGFIHGIEALDSGQQDATPHDAFVTGVVPMVDAGDASPHDGFINGITIQPDANLDDGSPGLELLGVVVPPPDAGPTDADNGDVTVHGVMVHDV
jgi:hypothetical protein